MSSPAVTAMVKQPPRILIVDDEPTVTNLLTDVFQGRFVCDSAASAREALSKLANARSDLVLTDIDLPDMSGFDLIKRIEETHPTIPYIAMSGRITPGSSRAASDLDPFLISKPIDIDQLEKLIDDHFKGFHSVTHP